MRDIPSLIEVRGGLEFLRLLWLKTTMAMVGSVPMIGSSACRISFLCGQVSNTRTSYERPGTAPGTAICQIKGRKVPISSYCLILAAN
jgi:hypothetical protein